MRVFFTLWAASVVLTVSMLFTTSEGAEQYIQSDATGNSGDYPFGVSACGGTTVYLAQDYDLTGETTACALRHVSKWQWSDTDEGTGTIRARIYSYNGVGGAPDLALPISEWSSTINVADITQSQADYTFTWTDLADISGGKIAVVYEWQSATCTGTLNIRRKAQPSALGMQMYRYQATWDNTNEAGRTFKESNLYYDDSAAVCSPAAQYVTFTGDSKWTGDAIVTDKDGVALTSQTGICWGWYDNTAISETPAYKDGACDASTDASGYLNQIAVDTNLATGATGLLMLKTGTKWGAYYMTVQE